MQPNPTVVTFNLVRPKVLNSSLGEAPEGSAKEPSAEGQSPVFALANPMREPAPTTGRIKPAERKARREVFDFMDAPRLGDKPS
jgi:hypothetical protein